MAHPLLIYTVWESPVGALDLASTPHGLCRVGIGIAEGEFTQQLAQKYQCRPLKSPLFFNLLKKKFADYFNRDSQRISCPLDLRGATPFQLKVWKKLAEIPYGETKSYQWVAEQIGNPQACRAVGQASSANPLPIIIPCHRVIKADDQLGGYTAGNHIKRQLLELEDCHI